MEIIHDYRDLYLNPTRRVYDQSKQDLTVKEIMSKPIHTIEKTRTTYEVAKQMTKHEMGCIIVTNKENPEGIITERDILEHIKENHESLKLEKVMSKPLITIPIDSSIKDAAKTMIKKKNRLIVTQGETPVGVVTTSDLVKNMPSTPQTREYADRYMTTPVETVPEKTSIKEAASTLDQKRIGSLIVTRNDVPIGIFTERDIIEPIADKTSLSEPINYTEPLLAIPTMTRILGVAKAMTGRGIRRLPVAEETQLIGIITARDLVEVYSK
ncbi:CBS domain-containing protein [Candidatus Bathyarchaeota archaeon]|nr:CBS domain-containing protein [Candidatus Bathyarchaeota archaeon]